MQSNDYTKACSKPGGLERLVVVLFVAVFVFDCDVHL